MKTESVSIEMRMPECYSDMHDSEKGLTGGTSEKEASTGEVSTGSMIAAGGITVATVGMGIAGSNSINNPNVQKAGVALAVVGTTAAIIGLLEVIDAVDSNSAE